MNRETAENIPEPAVQHGALAPLPAGVVQKWKKVYADKLQEELGEEPDRELGMRRENIERRHWKALCAANKMFRTPACTNYAEAADLEDWQVIKRVEENGTLKVVTIDAKKYVFPKPAAA